MTFPPAPYRARDAGRSLRRTLLLFAVLLSVVACHRGVKYQRVEDFKPMPRVEEGWSERGIASWYGHPFHGRLTANGERYDMYKLSCAHKTLPLGTVIRVENRANGRHLDLRVNDRGPYVRGRIIDCSKAAAWKLGFLDDGLAPVHIQVVRRGTGRPLYYREPKAREGSPDAYEYTLQLGAFSDPALARRLAGRLQGEGEIPRIEVARVNGRQFHRVRLGRYPSKASAADAAATLYARGHDVYIALME
ncbi:MAG: septal ring lytic transglycosylase RlpA family protein [Nitrospirota bacterium]|jgi:rare lipoprotein A